MEKHEINLTFPTLEDCQRWEDEHIANGTYEGGVVMMVNHQSSIFSDEVTITDIWTI